MHPLTSFAARGRKYYVDAQNFPNKELLVRGAGRAACCMLPQLSVRGLHSLSLVALSASCGGYLNTAVHEARNVAPCGAQVKLVPQAAAAHAIEAANAEQQQQQQQQQQNGEQQQQAPPQ